jgi:hypothetical protein
MKNVILMAGLILLGFSACTSGTETKSNTAEGPATPAVSKTAAVTAGSVILPTSNADPLKKGIEAFARGDIDGFVADMADDVKLYYPVPGDSLTGRQAVKDFFARRRALSDSILILRPTYLALDNKDSNNAAPGRWNMAWLTYAIKYKNGKRVILPMHVVQHQNAEGKVDRQAMYYDAHRVMEASK